MSFISSVNFVSSKRVIDVSLVECGGGQMVQHVCFGISKTHYQQKDKQNY